ncbi:hypothetical protein [Candidatus Clostridium stratigraminis]|uniref:Uncharacterized protein n=1 Tax=Candidatus Clostridium stratigraminis TaxID=3381661 RepID=A0ABW8T2Q8_9CLOT
MKMYTWLRALELKGGIECVDGADCNHCPYEQALMYAGSGCDVYYKLQKSGVELDKSAYKHLDKLEEEYSMLSARCDKLRSRRNKSK